MKVKQCFVNEIMDLKSEIKSLRLEVAKKESKIELLEKNEFDFKSNLNKNYGIIGAVRELIANNLRYDELTGTAVGVSMKPDDFKDMLDLLDITPLEEDSKNQNIPQCDYCTYSTPDGSCSLNDCTAGDKFEPVHVCDTCKHIHCPGDVEPCLSCTGDCSRWERTEDVKTED